MLGIVSGAIQAYIAPLSHSQLNTLSYGIDGFYARHVNAVLSAVNSHMKLHRIKQAIWPAAVVGPTSTDAAGVQRKVFQRIGGVPADYDGWTDLIVLIFISDGDGAVALPIAGDRLVETMF